MGRPAPRMAIGDCCAHVRRLRFCGLPNSPGVTAASSTTHFPDVVPVCDWRGVAYGPEAMP